jgi:YidC/Oxa1 family membrane protein insertase
LALTSFLSPIAGAGAAALAVVLVTLVVRGALIPVGVSQARAERDRARLAPRLRTIRERWGKNPERLQRETMQLYRNAGVSPFAGCLPVLAQAPVVGLLYAVFLHSTVAGHANALLTQQLAGVPLGTSLLASVTGGTADATTFLLVGILVAVIAGAGELTRRFLRPPFDPATPRSVVVMTAVLPFTTAVVALFVPLAAGVYLAVTTLWTFAQRLILRRIYPIDDGRAASHRPA